MEGFKPFKIEKHSKYYFDTYYFHCVDCGSEFTRHRFDRRTNPYCSDCNRKRETLKAKERAKRKENVIRNRTVDEFADRIKCEFRIPFELVDEIAKELKGGE